MAAGTTLTLDGNSTISGTTDINPTAPDEAEQSSFSVFTSVSGPPLGTILELNGTITLGAIGQNILGLEDVNTVGGAVIENGESDIVHVGINPNGDPDEGIGTVTGTDFQINAGVMTVLGPSGFGGTIGPITASGPNAPSIGIFGEVDIYNATAVASATFDTSIVTMSFSNTSGNTIGDMHFAGNASGLVLDRTASGSVIAIHDTGANPAPQGPGSIPLAFIGAVSGAEYPLPHPGRHADFWR